MDNKICLDWLIQAHNFNSNVTLSELNHAILDDFFFLFLATIFTLAVGTVGNLTCLMVYWKSIGKSRFRTYVLYISSIDTISCVVFTPTVIIYLISPLNYPSEAACIFSHYVGDFTKLAGSMALLLIALERCRHVFKPHISTSREGVKVGFFFGIFFAFLAASPRLKMMGVTELTIKELNITARPCFKEKEFRYTEFGRGYVVFINMATCILSSLALLASSISMVRARSVPQFKVREEMLPTRLQYSKNLTTMMFIATLKFTLVNFPLSVFLMTRYLEEDHECILNFVRGLLMHLFGFLLVLHLVLNPFIYGYFDSRFRQEVGSLFFTFTRTQILDHDEEKKDSLVASIEFPNDIEEKQVKEGFKSKVKNNTDSELDEKQGQKYRKKSLSKSLHGFIRKPKRPMHRPCGDLNKSFTVRISTDLQ